MNMINDFKNKPKVLVTRKIPQPALDILTANCEIEIWEHHDQPIPRDILMEKIVDKDGLYSLLTDKVDQHLLQQANKLKIVSNMAVGYDNIDIAACRHKDIMVTNTPGILTETTADLVFALLLATARNLINANNDLREGNWKTWSPMQFTGQDVFGATMGIVGMGRIGEAVARRAKGFNMKITYYNRNKKEDVEQQLGIEYREFDELLKESDYVVVLTPLTEQTKNLIAKRELSLMKSNAILINCARGSIVNEEDLFEALVSNQIWAAGLDVYEKEPIDLNHPLLSLSNIVLLPHIGSASIATRTKMAIMAAENLTRGLKGETPPNLILK